MKCGSQKKPTKTLVIEQGPGGVVGLSRYLGEVKLGAEQAVSMSNRQKEKLGRRCDWSRTSKVGSSRLYSQRHDGALLGAW